MIVAKNYRIFPVQFPQRFKSLLAVFLIVILVTLTALLTIVCIEAWGVYQQNHQTKIKAQNKLRYWESMVAKYPQFPTAYYEVAVYAYQLEQPQKAQEFLKKAIELDPDFLEAEKLVKDIETQ
jgi:tetratricopeptide (TPR) repeat protein